MRVYFEKPRTTVGWKGLINDPHPDGGSQDIETGLKIARRLLLEISSLGLPAATEFLDPIVPQYIADLIPWAAIGARTGWNLPQTHREMASGLFHAGLASRTARSAVSKSRSTPWAQRGISTVFWASTKRASPPSSVPMAIRMRMLCCAADGAADQLRRGEHQGGGTETRLRKIAAGVDGGLQPRQLGKEICQTGRDVWRNVIQQRVEGTSSLIGLMVESHLCTRATSPSPKIQRNCVMAFRSPTRASGGRRRNGCCAGDTRRFGQATASHSAMKP